MGRHAHTVHLLEVAGMPDTEAAAEAAGFLSTERAPPPAPRNTWTLLLAVVLLLGVLAAAITWPHRESITPFDPPSIVEEAEKPPKTADVMFEGAAGFEGVVGGLGGMASGLTSMIKDGSCDDGASNTCLKDTGDILSGAATACAGAALGLTLITGPVAFAAGTAICGGLGVAGSIFSTAYDDTPTLSDLEETMQSGFDRMSADITKINEKVDGLHALLVVESTIIKDSLENISQQVSDLSDKIDRKFLDQRLHEVEFAARKLKRAQLMLAHANPAQPSKSALCPFDANTLLDLETTFGHWMFDKFARELFCSEGPVWGQMFLTARTTLVLFRATCERLEGNHDLTDYFKKYEEDVRAYTATLQQFMTKLTAIATPSVAASPPTIDLAVYRCATRIDLSDFKIKGTLKHLSRAATHISIVTRKWDDSSMFGYDHLVGSAADLPKHATHIHITTNAWIGGSLRDLPRGATHLELNPTQMRGSVEDIPKGARHISVDFREITGSLKALNRHAKHVALFGKVTDGAVKDLPRHATYIDIRSDVAGSLSEVPWRATTVILPYQKIEGHLKDLPRTATVLGFWWNERIQGSLSDLPSGAKHITFKADKNIKGSLGDLPKGAEHLDFRDNKNIDGSLLDLPRTATYMDFSSSAEITGSVADLPPGTQTAKFDKSTKIVGSAQDAPDSTKQAYFHHFYFKHYKNGGGINSIAPVRAFARSPHVNGLWSHVRHC